MRRQRLHKSVGQCIAEYVILFSTVSAVVFSMVYYMRASIQRVIQKSADQVGKQTDALDDFESGGADTDYVRYNYSDSKERTRVFPGGGQKNEIINGYNESAVVGKSITKEEITE
jgi:hypothetical protein